METFVWSLNTNNLFGSICYMAVTTTFPAFASRYENTTAAARVLREISKKKNSLCHLTKEKQALTPRDHSLSLSPLQKFLPAQTLDPTCSLMKR